MLHAYMFDNDQERVRGRPEICGGGRGESESWADYCLMKLKKCVYVIPEVCEKSKEISRHNHWRTDQSFIHRQKS
jgi:hypothetical protein